MKILVVIPIYNESRYLKQCLDSFSSQDYKHITYICVDDASTDNSLQIAQKIAEQDPRFIIKSHTGKSEHQPGAKVIKTFYEGYNLVDHENYDLIGKFDADILLPQNYFTTLVALFQKQPQCGIAGGLLYIQKNNEWVYENISNKKHVRGPIKLYRKQCFQDIGGLRPILGWDNIDTLLAKTKQWKIITQPQLQVKHLRPTGNIYKTKQAQKLGEYFYNIGYDLPLSFISCIKASIKQKSIRLWLQAFVTYLIKHISKAQRGVNKQEMKAIQIMTYKTMKEKIISHKK